MHTGLFYFDTRESFFSSATPSDTAPHSIAVAELEPILFFILPRCRSFVLTYIDRYGPLFQQGSIGRSEVPVVLEKLTSWMAKEL
jgi:hypothetical protein